MKNNFASVSIAFVILLVKCVVGCVFDSPTLNCSTMADNFKEVPRYINAGRVEVFDLSKNPLTEGLRNDSFKYYRNVRVLILRLDNLNSDTIEANAFSSLTKLTTLDLSENSLDRVPCSLPSSLVNLDLGGNPISDETGCGFDCLSLPTSLETLSLRNTRGRSRFPRFCESTPNILELDISRNALDSVSADDLAPLCGLQRINLTSVTVSHSNGTCQKLQFEKWLADRDIEAIGSIKAINDNPNANCNLATSAETMEIYQDCTYKLYVRKYLWASIGVGFAALACILIAVLWWRKRKRALKKLDLENSANAMVTIENRESDKN